MSAKTPLERMRAALQGCGECEYDEAEGGIMDHCPKCKLKVTQLAWDFFVVERLSIGAANSVTLQPT